MANYHCKLNCLTQKSIISKQNESHRKKKVENKIPSPIEKLKSISLCGDSIKQLEDLRIKKQNLERVGDCPRVLTVWERLNKGKRGFSPGGHVIGNPYRHEMCLKSCPKLRGYKNIPTLYISEREPIKKNVKLDVPKKSSLKNHNHCIFVDSSLTEVFTSSQFNDSKSSVEEITPTTTKTANISSNKDEELKIEISDDDLIETFESAMSLQSPTHSRDSITCNTSISLDFRSALENRHCFMSPHEISIIKDAIKSDNRLQVNCINDKIFIDVLRSTLLKVSKQEHVLKLALQNLTSNQKNLICSFEKSQQSQSLLTNDPEVHVIFKDLPHIKKKDFILNTLKTSIAESLMGYQNKKEITTKSVSTLTTNIQVTRTIYYVSNFEQNATCRVWCMGVCMHIAFIREFQISRKTLTELENDKRIFYLPVNDKHTELKRTSFKRLKRENPQLLMSFMQPKDSIVSFNVLEQDSIFFNSFFYKSLCGDSTSENTSDEDEKIVMCESNEISRFLRFQRSVDKFPLKIEEISSNEPQQTTENEALQTTIYETIGEHLTVQDNNKIKKSNIIEGKVFEPKRHGKRRLITPLSERRTLCPKNRLLPIILVAIVELSIFLMLIISFKLPAC